MIVKSNTLPTETLIAFAVKIAKEHDLTPHDISAMHLCLSSGQAFLIAPGRVPIAGIGYTHGTCPRTSKPCFAERMIYVDPEIRDMGYAQVLLNHLETYAKELGVGVIYAGSSLDSHEAARKLYEGAGFSTTYSFRKEL